MAKIIVKDTQVSVIKHNTIEFLGIWEKLMNPDFNCAEFDIIKSQAGRIEKGLAK